MGLLEQGAQSEENRLPDNAVIIRPNLKDGVMYVVKENGVWYGKENKKAVGGIDGQFVKIEENVYLNKFDNEMHEGVRIYLQDGDIPYVIEADWRQAIQSIVNSMAGAETLGKLTIKTYLKDDGYARASIYNDNQRMSRKYQDPKEFIVEGKVGTKTVRDDSPFIEKLKGEIESINKKSSFIPKEDKDDITKEIEELF